MATGENTTTWGDVTNVNLGTALEEAIVGSADVAFSDANVTLTLTNTNSTQPARNVRLNLTGTATSGYNLVLGSGCQIDKPYIINNGTDGTITVKNTTGSGVAVPAGKTMWVFNNGTDVVDVVTQVTTLATSGNVTIGGGGDLVLSSATGGNSTTFYNDSQDLNINVNSAVRVFISSTGLTGIGATAPKTRLQVTAGGFLNAPVLGSATGAPFYVTNSDSSYGLIVGINSADGRAFLQAQRTDGTASSGPITLNEAGGNVGVGTASPTFKLVAANNTFDGVGLGSSSTYSFVTLGGYFSSTAGAAQIGYERTNGAFVFGNGTRDVPTERMRIDNSGNLGIGTSTPARKLDVAGGGRFLQDTAATTGAIVLRQNSGNTVGGFIQWVSNDNTAEKGWMVVDTSSNMLFAPASSEKMRIASGGNVGIGTNNPSYKLEVAGDVRVASGGDLRISAAASGNDVAMYNDAGDLYWNNGIALMYLSATGDLTATGNVTGYSDVRLKTDLTRIEGALDKLETLTGYTYTRTDSGNRQTGLLAQDVQAVLPEAVVEGEYLSVAYGNMLGLVVEAIKELRAEVAELRQQAVKVVK
jgi:hypothetical protein